MKFLYSSLLILSSSFAFAQTWEPVGDGVQWTDSTSDYLPVYTLRTYMNKLYIGGSFKMAGKVKANNIASWDGNKWDTILGGTNGPVMALGEYKKFLFVGGVFNIAGKKHANNIAYWIDTTRTIPRWYYMGKGIDRIQMSDENGKHTYAEEVVNAFGEYNGNLYIGGFFTEVGILTVGKIVRWNDIDSWSPVGKSMQYQDGTYMAPGFLVGHILAITPYKGKLFVGGGIGDYYADKNIKSVAIWNDTIFRGPSQKIPENAPQGIRCMAVFDSCLYVGGSFNANQKQMPAKDKPFYGIAKWDGNKWIVIEGIQGFGQIYSMVVYNNKLYVGGRFDSIGSKSANNIAIWDGNTLEPVGAGFSNKGKHKGVVNALCVYKGELYAGGYFTSSGGVPLNHIARLNLNSTKPYTKNKK